MAFSDDFLALKRDLADADISVEDLLREARVNRSTWTRWGGKFSPRLNTWDSVLAALKRLTANRSKAA